MIKVLRHGDTISVQNPATGEESVMINVTFIEEGRSGADKGMSETTKFLQSITGDAGVGLNQVRIHTHPIMADKIGLFEIGREFPGHINRGLFSTPQIRQQVDKDPRIVDGKPTYFKTWISDKPEEDVDLRMDNNVLGTMQPSTVFATNVGAARVRTLETAAQKGLPGNPAAYAANRNANTTVNEQFVAGGAGQSGNATGAQGEAGGVDSNQRSEEQRNFQR